MRAIAVVGLPGTGKSTLIRKLGASAINPFAEERPEDRPFQKLCQRAPRRFAFLNQLDFLLHKAGLEQHLLEIQSGAGVGFLDSCIDQDFAVYTEKFRADGWLSKAEYTICREFYEWYRNEFAKPSFVVVTAEHSILRNRVRTRSRKSELVTEEALMSLELYFHEFLRSISQNIVLRIDTSCSDIGYDKEVAQILALIASG